uniref:Uncharacterized protein n=1 Tax=Utricularia reniformis TaxID=192314 RepID=A0A1Y0B0Y9_9LAMI|nr:hypothetical protein AEK19_MT0776 [Utricularia reniformis]ART31019.1 hypothetical protein AEK19_MT0776 [Utricularia reniformis]
MCSRYARGQNRLPPIQRLMDRKDKYNAGKKGRTSSVEMLDSNPQSSHLWSGFRRADKERTGVLALICDSYGNRPIQFE